MQNLGHEPTQMRQNGLHQLSDCGSKGYGWIKVFRTVDTNGDAEYWATSRLDMTIEQATFHALDAWQIEVSQRNHIGLAIRAFVRLEVHRLRTGIPWFEAKTGIIRFTDAYMTMTWLTILGMPLVMLVPTIKTARGKMSQATAYHPDPTRRRVSRGRNTRRSSSGAGK